jgi:hypothetical protein
VNCLRTPRPKSFPASSRPGCRLYRWSAGGLPLIAAVIAPTPLDNIRERNWLSVQRRLWTHDYSPQAFENISLVPQYFALALTDLVVETAYGGVGAGAGPDLGQRVELAPNLFGLRCHFDLRFRGAVGHPWESALSCISLNRGPSGLGKMRTDLDRDPGASRTTWVSVWANRARSSDRLGRAGEKGERAQLIERGDPVRGASTPARGATGSSRRGRQPCRRRLARQRQGPMCLTNKRLGGGVGGGTLSFWYQALAAAGASGQRRDLS